jgi:hypothetical protein
VSQNAQNGLTLRFRSASVSLDDLEGTVSSLFAGLRDPGTEIARDAAGMGMVPAEFDGAGGVVDQDGKGFGDVVVVVALFAPTINHSLRTVWDDLLWPHIKRALGADALGDEAPASEPDEDELDAAEVEAVERDAEEAAES